MVTVINAVDLIQWLLGDDGQSYNINADLVAGKVAEVMQNQKISIRIILCSDALEILTY